MKRKGWGKSILSDAITQINEATMAFTADKEKMIEKILKKYCQKYGLDYRDLLDSGMLSSKVLQNREVFLFNGTCIFYIQKTKTIEEFPGMCFENVIKMEFIEKF